MTQVGIYGEIEPEPSRNPSGYALGISLVLRLYSTVYPSSRHNTDTVLVAITIYAIEFVLVVVFNDDIFV